MKTDAYPKESHQHFLKTRFKTCPRCKAHLHVSLFLLRGKPVRLCNYCRLPNFVPAERMMEGSACAPYHDQLVAMAEQGLTARQIAIKLSLSITPGSVIRYLAENRVKLSTVRNRNKYSHSKNRLADDEFLEKMRLLVQQKAPKLSLREIAKAMGLDDYSSDGRNTVTGYIWRYRLRDLKERPKTFLSRWQLAKETLD